MHRRFQYVFSFAPGEVPLGDRQKVCQRSLSLQAMLANIADDESALRNIAYQLAVGSHSICNFSGS
jgi:hypothetical protein